MDTTKHPMLDFTVRFFNSVNLQTHVIDWSNPLTSYYDGGLRQMILAEESRSFFPYIIVPDLFKKNIICIVTDQFLCRYIMIPVPDEQPDVLLAGPFLVSEMGLLKIQKLCEQKRIPPQLISALSQYYSTLPSISEEGLLEAFVNALGVSLFGQGRFSLQYIKEKDEVIPSVYREEHVSGSEDTAAKLAHRYEIEEAMMDAIARGDTEAAVRYQHDPVFKNLDERVEIPLRNQKNYQIILNTLCRKAAQRGGVHPLYLDEISRHFSIMIENTSTMSQSREVEKDIVRRYCMLVRSQATPGYSPLIHDICAYINAHYADTSLTLENIAAYFSMNKSYLATLFKKETGTTLTSYVNACRIKHAIYLLNTQSGTIQSIASACGIPDITYFTRLFKREKGMTPSEYKKMLLRS